jgi:ribosomal protein S18 acetylase RimI-like enzyme
MIKIRQARTSDLKQVSNLFDLYRIFYRQPSDPEGARDFIGERLANGDSVIFLAEGGDGKLIGFVQLYPLFSSVSMKREWLLNDLYVLTEGRNRGIAALLIERAKTLARGTKAKGIMLETEKSNEVGNYLYPKMEFQLIDDNFYFWENKTT